MAVQIPPPLFNPTALSTSNVTLYTAASTPPTLAVRNVRMRFANNTISSATVFAWTVPAGGSPSAANQCVVGEALAGNTHVDMDMPALGPSWTYVVSSGTANAITAFDLGAVIFS